jgi:transcriptional regulator with XRE-family HTH domain
MLSQQEVADRAGTSLFTIQRIERGEGNVRPKTGRAVASALGVPIEELLPKASAPHSSEPSFSDALDEERRAHSWRVWTDYVRAVGKRWEREYLKPNGARDLVLARELDFQARVLTHTITEDVVRPMFAEIRAGLVDGATEAAFRREVADLVDELDRMSDIVVAIAGRAAQQKRETQQLQRRQREEMKRTLQVIQGELAG